MLLPFYIINYENGKQRLEEDPAYLDELMENYRLIADYLEKELLDKEREKLYRDMMELITCVADYVLTDAEKAKKEVDRIMGGKVLKLKSDELIEQGIKQGVEQGIKQGVKQGVEQGIKQGVEQGLKKTACNMRKKDYPVNVIAEVLECSVETVCQWLGMAETAVK